MASALKVVAPAASIGNETWEIAMSEHACPSCGTATEVVQSSPWGRYCSEACQSRPMVSLLPTAYGRDMQQAVGAVGTFQCPTGTAQLGASEPVESQPTD